MSEVEISVDRREEQGLRRYLEYVDRYELLTKDEEFGLARRVRGGDRDALDLLIQGNLRFVVAAAGRYCNRGLSYMDLIAEGNVGLISAARRFDGCGEFRLISYAMWWIHQAIVRAIAEHALSARRPLARAQNRGR